MVTFIKYLQRFLPILVDTPDPYVKLLIKTAPNGKKQTTVKSNTANPIWDETFQFLLEPDLENILGKLVLGELVEIAISRNPKREKI